MKKNSTECVYFSTTAVWMVLFIGYMMGRVKRNFRKNWLLNRFGVRWCGADDAFSCRHMLEVHHHRLSLFAGKTIR